MKNKLIKENFNNCNGAFFCDESGFSGNIKNANDIDSYLKQPLFVVAGIFVKNYTEYLKLENIYKVFLKNNKIINKELKGYLFSKENNKILKNFIELVVDVNCWKIAVVDKKFNIFQNALILFFPYEIDFVIKAFYRVLEKNDSKKILL